MGEVEGGWSADDDGGGKWAVFHREMMGGGPQPRTSMRNGKISEIKCGRGQKLTGGSSTPPDLRTVSGGKETQFDVVLCDIVVVSAVGAVSTSPTVKFCEGSTGVGWDRQSSTTTTLLALPL